MRQTLLPLLVLALGLPSVTGCDTDAISDDALTNQDVIVRVGLQMLDDAKAWALQPAPDGGGGSFWGLTLDEIGYDTGSNRYHTNLAGRFYLTASPGTPGSIAITACGEGNDDKTMFVAFGLDAEDYRVDTDAYYVTCP